MPRSPSSSSSSSSSSMKAASRPRTPQNISPKSVSRSSPSARSKSMGSTDIEMFPRTCTRAFINRTRKASFQKLAKELGLEIGFYGEKGTWIEYTKGKLCNRISDKVRGLKVRAGQDPNAKPTKKAKPTSPARKNARSRAPVKAAHKS